MIVVRPLRFFDLPSFIRLRHELGESGTTRFLFVRKFFGWGRVQTLVAVGEGQVVGYLTVVFAKFAKFRGNAYIARVSVRTAHRGRGIGSELLGAVETVAKRRGARRLELEVFGRNQPAMTLYQRLGYEEEGRRRRAVNDSAGDDDIVLMAKFI